MRLGMKIAIIARKVINGKVVRVLHCGHEQLQPSGGKSSTAQSADCKTCTTGPELAPVIELPKVTEPEKVEPVEDFTGYHPLAQLMLQHRRAKTTPSLA
jgi:hypothetical protein